MFNHERFRELIALGSIGQLSSDENREIEEHLKGCADCRTVQEDYSRVIFHELPKTDPVRWRSGAVASRPGRGEDLRDGFLARAFAEGIQFSRNVERPRDLPKLASRWMRPWQWQAALSVFAVILLSLTGIWLGRRYELASRSRESNSAQALPASEKETLQAEVSTSRKMIEQQSAELTEMKQKVSVSDESLRRLERELASAQKSAVSLSAELSQTRAEKATVTRSEEQKDTLIADLRTQNDVLSRQSADSLGDSVIQASRIRQLTQSLDEERVNLERERQLMAVSNDVRQLMGARNLHIVDVLDVNGEGRSNKAFGRVFYAEGQSLIFYAFDLPSGGLNPAKYTFNAWGQEEARPRSPRKLGVFEIDSHDQRRWVLKINNSALLARIDSVFVTAESLGETKEPRGKKLLYAYIGGQPNHP